MNGPPLSPTPTPPGALHFCFGGLLTCSGCNPCAECLRHVRDCVLELVIREGAFDGRLLADLHLFAKALHDARIDPLRLAGSTGTLTLFAKPQDVVVRCAAAFTAGFDRLRYAMENVPQVGDRVIATDVGVMIAKLDKLATIEPARAPTPAPVKVSRTKRSPTIQDLAMAAAPVPLRPAANGHSPGSPPPILPGNDTNHHVTEEGQKS